MRSLSVYASPPLLAVETAQPLDRDAFEVCGTKARGRACTRCKLHEGAITPCIAPDGEAGGLLVIGEGPGANEDAQGAPFVGASGDYLKAHVHTHWRGPICFDNATRCRPVRHKPDDKHIDACRGFLTQTMREVRPTRIIALGAWAALSVAGRTLPPLTSRRCYAYIFDDEIGPCPVFFVMHPAAALRNRFMRKWFEEDLKWALTCPDPPPAPVRAETQMVTNEEEARFAIRELRTAEWSVFDVETAGIMHTPSFRLLCLSFCSSDGKVFTWTKEATRDAGALSALAEYMGDVRAPKYGQNVKYDVQALRLTKGIYTRGIAGDTRLWRKLMEPEAEGNLARMMELVGMGGAKEEARDAMRELVDRIRKGIARLKREREYILKVLPGAADFDDETLLAACETAKRLGEKKLQKRSIPAFEGVQAVLKIQNEDPELWKVIEADPGEWERYSYALCDDALLYRYNARDVIATARLVFLLKEQLATEPELDRTRKVIVDPAGRAITRVESWGIATDRGAIQTFDQHLETLITEKMKVLRGYDAEFNPDSPQQVATLLFEKLQLRAPKLTKGGALSTDAKVLEVLKDKHPIAAALHEYRKVTKLKGTYAEGLVDHIRPDGRIYTSILLDGARSGRTSSVAPNMQNIPRASTPLGKMARDCFVPGPGRIFIQLDYSQLELRIACALSGDEEMLKIFVEGVDYHQRTAELVSQIVWGVASDKVTKEMRSIAKTFNFGMLYGMGDPELAKRLGCSVDKAGLIREAILGKFKKLAKWIEARKNETRHTGYAWTWWDGERARRRPLFRIADQGDDSSSGHGRSQAENGSFNTPVQGTASDFCIASLSKSVDWIDSEGIEEDVKLILPVHDSLLFEARPSMVSETIETVRDIMTSWPSAGVPLVADVEVGHAWGSLKKVEAGQNWRDVLHGEKAA